MPQPWELDLSAPVCIAKYRLQINIRALYNPHERTARRPQRASGELLMSLLLLPRGQIKGVAAHDTVTDNVNHLYRLKDDKIYYILSDKMRQNNVYEITCYLMEDISLHINITISAFFKLNFVNQQKLVIVISLT